jgi:fimbrial chaperone protein
VVPSRHRRTGATLAGILLGMLCGVVPVRASAFRVSPVQVALSAQVSSTLLTLSNESSESLRFQVRAFAWNQNPKGEMELAPTEDIVVFPTLVTLPAGTDRKVRIGLATSFGASEKTYRVFFEELPPAEGARPAATRSEVRILTKMGIPIFLQPSKPRSAGAIDGLTVDKGHLRFLVRNDGNTHFVLRTVRVKGIGAAGDAVLDHEEEGWYVLPGGTREYDLTLPADQCSKIKGVTVESQTEADTFKARMEMPPEGCGAPDAPPPSAR